MRINNPIITLKDLENKILHKPASLILDKLEGLVEEIGYEDIGEIGYIRDYKWFVRFKKNITQKEIIELYYKLDK